MLIESKFEVHRIPEKACLKPSCLSLNCSIPIAMTSYFCSFLWCYCLAYHPRLKGKFRKEVHVLSMTPAWTEELFLLCAHQAQSQDTEGIFKHVMLNQFVENQFVEICVL